MNKSDITIGLRVRIQTETKMLAEPGTHRAETGSIRHESGVAPFTESMVQWIGRTATVVSHSYAGVSTDLRDTDFYLKFDEPITTGYVIHPFMLEPAMETTITSQIATLEAQVAKLKADYAASLTPVVTRRWYTLQDIGALCGTAVKFDFRVKRSSTATSIAIREIDLIADGTVVLYTNEGPNIRSSNFTEYQLSRDGGNTWEPAGVVVK